MIHGSLRISITKHAEPRPPSCPPGWAIPIPAGTVPVFRDNLLINRPLARCPGRQIQLGQFFDAPGPAPAVYCCPTRLLTLEHREPIALAQA
jgi:hypothetical protein